MSNLFLSGFDACLNSGDYAALGFTLISSPTVAFDTGLLGDGKCLRLTGSGAGRAVSYAFSEIQDGKTLIIGFRFKCVAADALFKIAGLYNSGLAEQCNLYINAAGKLELRNNTTVLATSTTSVNDGSARYIEWEILVSNTGSSKLRINGSQEWTVSSVDTMQQSTNSVSYLYLFNASAGSGTYFTYFDDMYVNNTDGTVNNSYESSGANFRVKAYAVTSNSSIASTSSGGGAGTYTNIDETIGTASDSDYNLFTANGTDKYGFADISETVSNVMGLQVWARAQLSTGTGTFKIGTDSAGNLQSTSKTPGAGFAWYNAFFPYETGTTAWSKTTVNAALATIEAVI